MYIRVDERRDVDQSVIYGVDIPLRRDDPRQEFEVLTGEGGLCPRDGGGRALFFGNEDFAEVRVGELHTFR